MSRFFCILFSDYPDDKVIFPQAARLSLIIIKIPFIPGIIFAFLMTAYTSSFDFIILHTDVAAESAKIASLAQITTESASPKLKEWPIVPDEVQTPRGESLEAISNKILLENFLLPE